MGSIEIFSDGLYISISFWTLALLLFVSIYSSFNLNINKAVWYLFAGLTVEFLTSWYGYYISYYNTAGVSISILVAIELFFLLISIVLLALAASEILIGNAPAMAYVTTATVFGLIAIIYFCFIYPDGDMINNMRKIFPIAGFAFLMASFWSQSFAPHHGGYLAAALVTTLTTFYLLMRFFGVNYFIEHTWYISALTYVGLSVSLLMMKTGYIMRRRDALENEVEKYNRRLEEIIKSSPFPIVISRLSDDKILLANDNAVKLFGLMPSELERYRLRDFFADADNRQLLTERLEQEKEVHDFEILAKAINGDTPFWLLTSANVIDYNYDIAIYSSFQDITSRKNRENMLKNQAIRDPLTSLFNRRYFEDEVNRRIAQAQTTHAQYSVLMIDADHFKRVNDTYGHKTGDKVLIELSSTAERSLRQDDIVARYGGEEFVVFLPELSAEEAKVVADRLRETISKIVVYSDQGEQVTFTVSIGISSSAISDNIDMLIKTSDEALYRAKENGRNRCEIFTVDDLKNFNAAIEYKDDSANHHPIFDKENTQEISLLDGIDANHILDSQTQIETPAPKTSAPAAEASVPSAGNAAETPVWNADAFAEPLPEAPAAETHEVVEPAVTAEPSAQELVSLSESAAPVAENAAPVAEVSVPPAAEASPVPPSPAAVEPETMPLPAADTTAGTEIRTEPSAAAAPAPETPRRSAPQGTAPSSPLIFSSADLVQAVQAERQKEAAEKPSAVAAAPKPAAEENKPADDFPILGVDNDKFQ